MRACEMSVLLNHHTQELGGVGAGWGPQQQAGGEPGPLSRRQHGGIPGLSLFSFVLGKIVLWQQGGAAGWDGERPDWMRRRQEGH